MNKDILVVYHKADFDGICSYQVAKRALQDAADYLGWDYGEPTPDLSAYRLVYIIDVSFPPEDMAKYADKLIWIDHHKSAIEKMKDIPIRGYRIDGVAACRLAHQWFLKEWRESLGMIWLLPDKFAFVERQVQEPYAVQLLGEYDIWDKRNPDVDRFQLGMLAEKTPDWNVLLKEDAAEYEVQAIIKRGVAIQAFTEATNAQIITERGFDVQFEGLTFRALNTARCNSMTFLAALRPEHDGCLAYFWNGRGWRFSLYHAPGKEHHDLSQIAIKFGGGGHRGACGFELEILPEQFGGFPNRLKRDDL